MLFACRTRIGNRTITLFFNFLLIRSFPSLLFLFVKFLSFFFNFQTITPDFFKKLSFDNQEWLHVLQIVVGSVKNVRWPLSSDKNNNVDFYLKFSYGSESEKTKVATYSVEDFEMMMETSMLGPGETNEVFIGDVVDFRVNNSNMGQLDIALNQNGSYVGRTTVDLTKLSIEQTHKFEQELSDNSGTVEMTVTLTGTRPDVLAALPHDRKTPTWKPHGNPIIKPKFLDEDEQVYMKEFGEVFVSFQIFFSI